MILFPHMLIGAVIGSKIHSFSAVFVLALISHFLTDMLPHRDYLNGGIEDLKGKKFAIFIGKSLIDLFAGLLVVWYFFHASPYLVYILFGAFISIIPDGLTLLNKLTNYQFQWLIKFQAIHEKIHIADKKNVPVPGLITEVIITVFLIALIAMS